MGQETLGSTRKVVNREKHKKKSGFKVKNLDLHLMLFPSILVLIIFCYVPMSGLIIAFQKFKPAKGLFGDQEWIGWGNFEYVFQMPNTIQVLENTLFIAVCKMVLGLLVPIIFALLINEVRRNRLKRSIQTLIYLPYFLSWVILAGIFIDMLAPSTGIINSILGVFHIDPIFFLGDNKWFRSTIVISDVWKNFGFGTIVFLASITGIDQGLYEAATIDGAGRIKQTIHVTLPGMRGIIVLMAVLSLGNILNAGFDQIFNLYSPIVYESGDIIDTFVYRLGIMEAQYGVSAAIGLFKSVISTICISTAYYLAYKLADYRIF